MSFAPMIDGRRRRAIALEHELRQKDRARRVQSVRQAKGLFGPTLAISRSDETYLGPTRRVNSSNAVDSIKTNGDTSAATFGSRTNDIESRNVNLVGDAEMLCDVLESAISKGDLSGITIAVELSLKVIDEIVITKHEFAERTSHPSTKDYKSENALATLSEVATKEQSLVVLSAVAASETPEKHFTGEVQSYAYSPAHDALVCIVDDHGDKAMYRALRLDELPRIGNHVTIDWDNDHGIVHDRTASKESTRGERKRKGT